MTTLEIRKSNVSGTISMSYNCKTGYSINFSNGMVLSFESNKARQIVWNKLNKMGFRRELNLSSDDYKGISQSTDAFNFKIIAL